MFRVRFRNAPAATLRACRGGDRTLCFAFLFGFVRALRGNSGPGANDENGAQSVAHHRLGDAAEQEPLQAPASVAPDHDEVSGPALCSLDDLGGRLSDFKEFKRRGAGSRALPKCRKQIPGFLLLPGDQVLCWNFYFWSSMRKGWINHVDKGQLCLERLCKLDADIDRMRGHRAFVHRDENSVEAHLRLSQAMHPQKVCNISASGRLPSEILIRRQATKQPETGKWTPRRCRLSSSSHPLALRIPDIMRVVAGEAPLRGRLY